MRAGGAVMAAAALLLLLSGCVAVPPPGPTAADVASFNDRMLAETWERAGLDEIADRPQLEPGAELDQAEWFDTLFGCMTDSGIGTYSVAFSQSSGFALNGDIGAGVEDSEKQYDFYRCVAAHPLVPGDQLEVLTTEQLDYIYDYYETSLVPCMVINGFSPSAAPTRVEFHALAGEWSPYYSVDVGLTGVQYEQIERICGGERPRLY